MFRRFAVIALALMLPVFLSSCSFPIFGKKPQALADYNEDAILSGGKGAVLLHAINRGGLIATRWLKVDNPGVRRGFTVYHSSRHRALDSMKMYDVVTVEPGTYALYSVFSNCEEGLRPVYTDTDEPWQESVATDLGMVSWLRRWKAGDISTGIGAWGSSSGNMGMGVSIGIDGLGGGGPGQPVAVCNLLSRGVEKGEALLATVTVRPGEVVYAGELTIDYGDNGNCQDSGNWLSDNETRRYCGAGWMSVEIANAYDTLARPFIEKNLGPAALARAVARPALPGSMTGR